MCDTFVERLTQQATPPSQRSATGEPAVDVGVVIAASSLLGADYEPAHLVGYGAISAGMARQLATGPSVFGRRLVCDPTSGELIDCDTRKRLFDGPLRSFIRTADQTCRRPGCESPIREIDHLQAHSRNGPTNGANGTGYCRADHGTKHSPGWDVRSAPAWAPARAMWQQPPPLDWSRRRRSGLPDRAHGTRHLTNMGLEGEVPRDHLSRRPSITWSTPTGHSYVSPPPPVLGHGSVPVADSVQKAIRRLDLALERVAALERMAAVDEHDELVDPDLDPPADLHAPLEDAWPGASGLGEGGLPPPERLDSEAWLEELERAAEAELLPCR